jgi:hypothetical protein
VTVAYETVVNVTVCVWFGLGATEELAEELGAW